MARLPTGLHAGPVLVLLLAAAASPALAQDDAEAPEFLLLGEDPAGDSDAPVIDLLNASIATSDTELLVRYGLSADSDPAGEYCWAFGYESGGDEFFPVICAEFVGGVFVEDVGWTTEVSSSRGTQIPESTGEFVAGGIVMHIPLEAAGLKVGDQIDDVYGLTYLTRALFVEDAIPDAKTTAGADESFGSYVVGGAQPAAEPPSATVAFHNLTGATAEVNATFANATSETHVYNWTTASGALVLNYTAAVLSGSVDVVVTDGANQTAANVTVAGNGSRQLDLDAASGNWTVRVSYHNFTGEFVLRIAPRPEAVVTTTSTTNDDNRTGTFPLRRDEKTPSLGVPLLLAATAAAAILIRRRIR